ncbi:MAG: hypothetical protein AAF628_37730 [Planctomycetota bacterium]
MAAGDELEFEWSWGGAPRPWRLVLLDRSLGELTALEVGQTTRFSPTGPLEGLAPGGSYYWLVTATDDPECRCSPVLIRLP